jgi:hypothetical protein
VADKGKTQLLITFVATGDKVDEIDRLVASHGSWMAKGHHREGPKALLSYNFPKGPELDNSLDPSSKSTGNTRYVLKKSKSRQPESRITGARPRSHGTISERWWRSSAAATRRLCTPAPSPNRFGRSPRD